MKLLWRPARISTGLLALVAVLSVGGYIGVESYRVNRVLPDYDLKLSAAKRTLRCYQRIKQERLARGIPIDPEIDPAGSGLIGVTVSKITSKSGYLPAKQTTVNPNWGAVFIAMFRKAGLDAGDTVALGVSSSFPAMNMAALAAAKEMKLRTLLISSLSASMWGANHPKLTWLDMETVLRKAGIIDGRSLASSLGGIGDRGVGIPRRGLKMLQEAIARNNGTELIGKNLHAMIKKRIALLEQASRGQPIAAYVNIGGGIASVGSLRAKKSFHPGVNLRLPPGLPPSQDGLMGHFARVGVPVIHIIHIKTLSARYGLPFVPLHTPKPGEGGVYRTEDYADWTVWAVLLSILAALVAITRVDLTFLLRRMHSPDQGPRGPAV